MQSHKGVDMFSNIVYVYSILNTFEWCVFRFISGLSIFGESFRISCGIHTHTRSQISEISWQVVESVSAHDISADAFWCPPPR